MRAVSVSALAYRLVYRLLVGFLVGCKTSANSLPVARFPQCAVDDYLRGIGFYVRFYERASADLGSEEAAAEGSAAAQQATAAQEAAAGDSEGEAGAQA